jgi:hypothetical protein
MTTVEVYNGYRLTTVEQTDGGWRVEIAPVTGNGKSVQTAIFQQIPDAMTEARLIVDSGVLA